MERGTPTVSEEMLAEKAREFFKMARELIDLCNKGNREVILCAIRSMVETADERKG